MGLSSGGGGTIGNGQPVRKLTSWIDSFVEYTNDLGVPKIFQKWTGLATVAGALERKVWLETNRGKVWPNMYTVLVGPAGVGKSLPLAASEELWQGLTEHHVAPISLTKASLVDAMADAKRKIIVGTDYQEFHCLLANISEFGNFLPAYENDFMNILITFWDGSRYDERRRSKDLKLSIPEPLLNILAGSTPSYVSALMPEGAWEQGFLSRTMIIYAGTAERIDPFAFKEDNQQLWRDLQSDLKLIGQRMGKIPFAPAAAKAISNWYLNDKNGPEHPKLVSYNARRLVHLLKLCMVYSVSRVGSHEISIEDFHAAHNTLVEAETYMADLFHAMKSGGDNQVMDELWHFIFTVFAKEKRPVAEHRIVTFLRERVPSHNIMKMIEIAVKSNMMTVKMSESGINVYTPASKSEF